MGVTDCIHGAKTCKLPTKLRSNCKLGSTDQIETKMLLLHSLVLA